MKIIRLKYENREYIQKCDELFKLFLESEGKYDNNYLKRENIPSFLEDIKDHKKFLYATIENDEVIAFLYAYISRSKGEKSDVLHIAFVYVDEKHRNKGIGTSLVENVIKDSKKENIQNIDIKVFSENIIANRLYKKLGFEPLWLNLRNKNL